MPRKKTLHLPKDSEKNEEFRKFEDLVKKVATAGPMPKKDGKDQNLATEQ